MRQFRWLSLSLVLLCCAPIIFPLPVFAQPADNLRMQRVLAKFVEQSDFSAMGVGSWIRGTGFDPLTSDFDMRLVIKEGGTEAQQLARWRSARGQLADLIRKEFGTEARDVLSRTNLYAPNQLMQGIENADDALERFQKLRTAPNLAHTGDVTKTTAGKFTEGLYGSGSQTYVQGYEQATGRLFYNNNGKCVTGLSELAHMGEGAPKYTALGTANTAGQWAEHGLNELRSGRADKVAKYLERLERDLVKSQSLSRLDTDNVFRQRLREMRNVLKNSPEKLAEVSDDAARLLMQGKAKAALLKNYQDAGSVRQAYLRLMMDGVTLKNKLGELIGKVMEKTPSWVTAENAMNYLVVCVGTAAVSETLGRGDDAFEAMSNVSGALNPFKTSGPLLLAEIMSEIIIQARANGFGMAAGFQGAWDLMSGLYSAWGRAGVDPDPRMKLTLADMVHNYRIESKLAARVYQHCLRASARDLGSANAQHDQGVADAIFAQCWPVIRDAWRWQRDCLATEYMMIRSEIIHGPLIIYYEPTEPQPGQRVVCRAVSADGKMGARLRRMNEIIRILYGPKSALKENYYWQPAGVPVGDRDWERGFTFDKPGTYPVKVHLAIEPHTTFTETEPRVMLRREVPAMVEVVVGGGKPPEKPGGDWVLFNKVITDNITPHNNYTVGEAVSGNHQFKGSTTETSASCSYTYIEERPKAETRGSRLTGPIVYPRYLKQVYARNATWTLPPERLTEGEKINFSLKLDTQGSEVVCDPPGAQGEKTDVTGRGILNYWVLLEPSKEQQAAWGAAPIQMIVESGVNTREQNKQDVWQVPGFDRERHVLVVDILFNPGVGVAGAASYSARYEYKFQPADGK